MKRTTVMMEEVTYEQLKSLARRRGVTAAALLREAVQQYLVESEDVQVSPLESMIGMFDGPEEDLGAQTKAIAGEAIARKHDARDGGRGDDRG